MCLAQIASQKKALYEGSDSWFSTYQLLVQDPTNTRVKDIVDTFDVLIEWLQAFYVLTPIADDFALECFVARLKASRYTVDETRLSKTLLGGRTHALYACNCQTFIHYCLCKHCVSRAMMDGVISRGPPQFAPERRDPEKAKPGRKQKARKGAALDKNG